MLYILFFNVFKLSKCTGVRNVFRHCLLDCQVTALPHWLESWYKSWPPGDSNPKMYVIFHNLKLRQNYDNYDKTVLTSFHNQT